LSAEPAAVHAAENAKHRASNAAGVMMALAPADESADLRATLPSSSSGAEVIKVLVWTGHSGHVT
jgi:hypothetical protein